MNIADLHATISVNITGEKSIKSLMGDLERVNGSFREMVGVNDQAKKRFSSLGGAIRSTGGFLTKFSGGLDNLKKSTGIYLTALQRLLTPLTAAVRDAMDKGRGLTGFRLSTGYSEQETDYVQRVSRITSRFANPLRREDAQQLFASLAGQLNAAQVSGQMNQYLAALGVNPYSSAEDAFRSILSNILAGRFSDRQLSAILSGAGLPTELKQFSRFGSMEELTQAIGNAKPYLTGRNVVSAEWFRTQWNRGTDVISGWVGQFGGKFMDGLRSLLEKIGLARSDRSDSEQRPSITQTNNVTINSTAPAGDLRSEFERQSASYLYNMINEESPGSYLTPGP